MTSKAVTVAVAAGACSIGVAVAVAGGLASGAVAPSGQGIDAATLARYHHTDQGTRLIPAAWLAALPTADGSTRLMSPQNTAKFGFLPSDAPKALNPYGWPVGFTVTDAQASGGVAVAGVTCAACHTGQLEYRGHKIRIEGGQSMADLPAFDLEVLRALEAVAKDPARRAQFFKDATAAGYPAERMAADFDRFAMGSAGMLSGQAALSSALPGPGRVDAVQGIVDALLRYDIDVPANRRSYDAPVSYPYLWDIWRLSWLQYNGFLPPQPLSRNIGEVLGVSARTNFIDAHGALNPEPQRWRTSIQFDNLQWMEATLHRLKAPAWPTPVFGPIDATKAQRGRQLFEDHCAGCHGIQETPAGRWDVPVVPLSVIGTDPKQATNWAGRTYDATKLGLGASVRAPDAAVIVNAVRNQYYADQNVPPAKREPDVVFGAPCGYKARPLIGVWATPPFLHNGSVRTVYDLLSDNRPAAFGVGTREYDPVRLGYVDDTGPAAFKFDSTQVGNSNAGHWWTDDAARPGRIGPKLSEPDKFALIEYLKAADYADYPRRPAGEARALPCADNPTWAVALAK